MGLPNIARNSCLQLNMKKRRHREGKGELQLWNTYLPSRVIVISEFVSGLVEEEAVLELPLRMRKTGCLGVGGFAASLSSKVITFDIVGRSLGSSCTHKSPTFTHLINSFWLQLSSKVLSIKSITLSTVQSSHACEEFHIQIVMII